MSTRRNCVERGLEHKFFVIEPLAGSVEGLNKVKLYAVIACTICGDSHLIEHVMDKESAAKITEKGK